MAPGMITQHELNKWQECVRVSKNGSRVTIPFDDQLRPMVFWHATTNLQWPLVPYCRWQVWGPWFINSANIYCLCWKFMQESNLAGFFNPWGGGGFRALPLSTKKIAEQGVHWKDPNGFFAWVFWDAVGTIAGFPSSPQLGFERRAQDSPRGYKEQLELVTVKLDAVQ